MNKNPNWLIFFRGVETTNQISIIVFFSTSKLVGVSQAWEGWWPWMSIAPYVTTASISRKKRRLHRRLVELLVNSCAKRWYFQHAVTIPKHWPWRAMNSMWTSSSSTIQVEVYTISLSTINHYHYIYIYISLLYIFIGDPYCDLASHH